MLDRHLRPATFFLSRVFMPWVLFPRALSLLIMVGVGMVALCGVASLTSCAVGMDEEALPAGDAPAADAFARNKHDMAAPHPDMSGRGRFRFAAFGDTRPGSPDAGSPYPTAVVESVFRAIDRQAVDFVVVSGDYIYVSGTNATRAAAQMDLFLAARAQLSASTPVYYVLGNHEDKNIPTFQAKLSPQVYWRVDTGALKVVAIANDAWDGTQARWLEAQLGAPTRYTFVFRHQYWGASGTTHDAEIKPIVEAHPYTLFIVGHDHSYKHKTTVIRGSRREVVAGNGGAPFDDGWTSPYYGYILVEQQPDDSVKVTSYKVEPGMDVPPVAMDSFSVSP